MADCGHDKIISELREEIRQLKSIIDNLVESNRKLQQRLAYYENPHSPPSQNSLMWRQQKKKQKKNEMQIQAENRDVAA
jgi:hypothetical protein